MNIALVLVSLLFLIALASGEFLFRSGQAGLIALGFVFGFNNFRPGELPRTPFYLLTMVVATVLSIAVVIAAVVIS